MVLGFGMLKFVSCWRYDTLSLRDTLYTYGRITLHSSTIIRNLALIKHEIPPCIKCLKLPVHT